MAGAFSQSKPTVALSPPHSKRLSWPSPAHRQGPSGGGGAGDGGGGARRTPSTHRSFGGVCQGRRLVSRGIGARATARPNPKPNLPSGAGAPFRNRPPPVGRGLERPSPAPQQTSQPPFSYSQPPAPPPPLGVRGLRWHNRPREREGKECGEADGHHGLRRERPREGKGKGRGKVRAGRKRKVKGW